MDSNSLPKIIFALVMLVLVFWDRGGFDSPRARKDEIKAVFESHRNLSATLEDNSPANSSWILPPTISASSSSAVSGVAEKKIDKAIAASASIFLVSDLEQDENFLELEADKRWPIASLTKLMTALIAAENISFDQPVLISESALLVESPSHIFNAGETYRAEDLIKSLFLVSANDAAEALAGFWGRDRFIAAMNAKAEELGMKDTYFKDPTGLSPINQSTANDLKKLARYISRHHKNLLLYSTEKEANIAEANSGTRHLLKNINYFAGENDFLGGKTGFIKDSGGNLVSLFARNGRTILIIVLNAADRFKDTSTILAKFDKINKQ